MKFKPYTSTLYHNHTSLRGLSYHYSIDITQQYPVFQNYHQRAALIVYKCNISTCSLPGLSCSTAPGTMPGFQDQDITAPKAIMREKVSAT